MVETINAINRDVGLIVACLLATIMRNFPKDNLSIDYKFMSSLAGGSRPRQHWITSSAMCEPRPKPC